MAIHINIKRKCQ